MVNEAHLSKLKSHLQMLLASVDILLQAGGGGWIGISRKTISVAQ
jgi:hypothetical protein